MLRLAVLAIVATVFVKATFDQKFHSQWELYKKVHHKEYEIEEESIRRYIFEENVARISQHNLLYDLGVHTYRLGLNIFADLTNDEFVNLLKRQPTGINITAHPDRLYQTAEDKVPDTVDWRQKGVVGPVRDQGQCGSPWAFAYTDSLESIQAITYGGQLRSLSVQQFVDCCGVGKGEHEYSSPFECVKDKGGLDTEDCYPTRSACAPGECLFNKTCVGVVVKNVIYIPSGDEGALQTGVATAGPIAVVIDASNYSFQLYSGGVYDEPNCSTELLDLAVLIVGYGTENGKKYWLVQNSWGENWGEEGYIRMSRDKNNQCGIATDVSYPIV